MRARIAAFVAVIQAILFFGHFVVYETWVALWGALSASALFDLRVALLLLSVSFVVASLLAFRFSNPLVRGFYRLAAAWLGLLNFLLCAASVAWIAYGFAWALGWRSSGRPIVAGLFLLAAVVTIYGIVNATRVRIKRISVKLPNLPDSWRGRTAALVSDTHLGHVRGDGFSRRIVAMLSSLRPDAVFIAGDLYDGTQGDYRALAKPWAQLKPPLGTYFVLGNHEEFTDPTKYLDAARSAGIRVLINEKAIVDGLQIVGVDFRGSVHPGRFESILRSLSIDANRASILLSHSPHHLDIPERAGISLQLSGHTHLGQIVPARWIVERIFGPYAYGLHAFGNMMVYTSSGAGTWGPPMRVGTASEVVLIQFE